MKIDRELEHGKSSQKSTAACSDVTAHDMPKTNKFKMHRMQTEVRPKYMFVLRD